MLTPVLSDADVTLYHGDALEVLKQLSSESVHCCVTSPPFYGLRDYGTEGQIGLEETPEQWVASLVAVFREVRRVIRPEGTLWLELGDSYARIGGDGRHGPNAQVGNTLTAGVQRRMMRLPEAKEGSQPAAASGSSFSGLKPKDLIGAPWMLAFALRADGWWLRSDIVWARPNPMPESVTDRPTKSHSYVFLLAKQPRYFFDQEAVREPLDRADLLGEKRLKGVAGLNGQRGDVGRYSDYANPAGRNVRSVWTIATQPYPEAHFATFPEELARRCILAGTSERGCCPECGTPWVRETEHTDEYRALLVQRYRPEGIGAFLLSAREGKGLRQNEVSRHFPSRTGGLTGCVSNWELGKNVPTAEQWLVLRDVLGFGPDMDEAVAAWHEYETGVWPEGPEWGVKRAPPSAIAAPVTLGWRPVCDCGKPCPTTTGCSCEGRCYRTYRKPPVPCVVLDPFVGSGTVPYVARLHGRHAIGIDLNENYLELAAKRLQQQSLFATEGAT